MGAFSASSYLVYCPLLGQKKIAKDDIGDGLLLLAGTLLATKDLLLREDVVPPHLDHQRAFLLCLRASGDTFSNDDTFRTGTQVILC